jgi:hypothetical protein
MHDSGIFKARPQAVYAIALVLSMRGSGGAQP